MIKKHALKKYVIITIIVLMLALPSCKKDSPFKVYDEIVHISSIDCDSITLLDGTNQEIEAKTYWSGVPIFIFDFIEGNYTKDESSILNNPNVIQLNLDVQPHNADVSSFNFEFDKDQYEDFIVFREDINAFVFLASNKMVEITVTSADGSNVSTTVKIIGRASN